MDPAVRRGGRAGDVVAVGGVAAVNDDVVRLQVPQEGIDGGLCDLAGGHHDPHRAGPGQLRHQVGRGVRADGALSGQGAYGLWPDVVDGALVPVAHQPPHQVGAHAAQPDHT
jgi:hypothetical protein